MSYQLGPSCFLHASGHFPLQPSMYGPDAIPSMLLFDVYHDMAKDPMGLLPSFPTFWCSNASDMAEGETLYLHIATFVSSLYIYQCHADCDDHHQDHNVSGTTWSHWFVS